MLDGLFNEMKRHVPDVGSDQDGWVRKMIRWHFSDDTGAPYWLGVREKLSFNPIADVQTVDDLALFGTFDKSVLRRINVDDLVPRGMAGLPRRVFETAGTSGPPCRIVDVTTGVYNVALYRTMLEARGLVGGNVLAMSPSGSHAYGTFVGRLADTWNGNVCYIDFDPRWVKELVRSGHSPDAYVSHLVAQTLELLETQEPRLLFTTSKLLMALVLAVPAPLSSFGVRAVCTGGTGCTVEEERYLQDNFLTGIQWIDTYGNTLMGHALQGDPWEDNPRRAYYLPPPQAFIRIVDPRDWRRSCVRGERGRVLLQTLHRDLFIPNLLERDSAIECGPHPWFPFGGISDVGPYFVEDAEDKHVEGVY